MSSKSQGTINERIRFLIEKLGMSVRGFSSALGVSDTNTRNYIDRGSKPNSEYLEKLLRQFNGINPAWLLLGEGEPFLSSDSSTPSANVSTQKKLRSQVIAQGKGKASINGGDAEQELAAARREIEPLREQVADKERTIQILLKQQS